MKGSGDSKNGHFFALPGEISALQGPPEEEFVEILAKNDDFRVERIISMGHRSAPGQWYDQPQDEWVILLTGHARLSWEDGREREFGPGDWVFIPAHERHRVEETSLDPACFWLAVHGPEA